jgi:hypothetical protein
LARSGTIERTNPQNDRHYILKNVETTAFDDAILQGAMEASRRPSIAHMPTSVYVILDRRHPEICKVGASSGTCEARLVEARRWTAHSCELVHNRSIGYGKGFAFEARVHAALEERFGEPQGEWFNCRGSDATAIIDELAREMGID